MAMRVALTPGGSLLAPIHLILPVPPRAREVLLGPEALLLEVLVEPLVPPGLGLPTGQEEAPAEGQVDEGVVGRLLEGPAEERLGLGRPAQVEGGLAAFEQRGGMGR